MAMEIFEKKTQYAVIGLGIFGYNVALSLVEEGAEVLVIDRDQLLIDKIKERPVYPFVLDSTNEDALKEAGVDTVDCAIVCIGVDMIASILTTLILKNFKIPKVMARANTEEHAQILRLIGVNEIIQPEVETGKKLARQLMGQGGFVLSYDQIWKDHAIVELKVSQVIAGKTLQDLDLRRKYRINVVAIKNQVLRLDDQFQNVNDYEIDEVPDPKDTLVEGDVLIIIGRVDDIKKANTVLQGNQ